MIVWYCIWLCESIEIITDLYIYDYIYTCLQGIQDRLAAGHGWLGVARWFEKRGDITTNRRIYSKITMKITVENMKIIVET